MSFRGINTTVIQIRRQVFTEVARMAYANVKGEQANHLMRKIPYTIIPGEEGKLEPEDITMDMIERNLYTEEIPPVDLVIRPSGEQRLSNFMIWQAAYAEFYYTNILWPDFKGSDLDKAVIAYSERNRRFGGV